MINFNPPNLQRLFASWNTSWAIHVSLKSSLNSSPTTPPPLNTFSLSPKTTESNTSKTNRIKTCSISSSSSKKIINEKFLPLGSRTVSSPLVTVRITILKRNTEISWGKLATMLTHVACTFHFTRLNSLCSILKPSPQSITQSRISISLERFWQWCNSRIRQLSSFTLADTNSLQTGKRLATNGARITNYSTKKLNHTS